MGRLRAPWLSLGAVVLLGACFFIVRASRTNSAQSRRIAGLEAENRDLRARLEARGPAAAAKPVQPLTIPPAAVEKSISKTPQKGPPRNQPQESAIAQQLREKLAAADASIGALQARVSELEQQVQISSEESKRLLASEAELTEKLASATGQVEALQADLEVTRQQLTQERAAKQKLQEHKLGPQFQSARSIQWMHELQDIDRRREIYLTDVVRRYRELTEQYHQISAMLENRRYQEGAAPGAAEFARIQNSLALAEEDMRQIRGLNAQALRIQKKIFGKD